MVQIKIFILVMYKINKKLYPYEYEFYRLGGHDTHEGRTFYLIYGPSICLENNLKYNIDICRIKLGSDKDIHIPETDSVGW